MISRRKFLKFVAGLGAFGTSSAAYGVGVEPLLRLNVARYHITPPRWPVGFELKLAVIADLHACDPWMSPAHIEAIVARTNALNADAVVMLGDYVAGHRYMVRRALEAAGIPVYENDVARLTKGRHAVWLAGLGDQLAFLPARRYRTIRRIGVDDLDATLAKVTDHAPVILLAHEPDIAARVPGRVALQLSGHTHGGQVRLFGWSPVVPSRYGNRLAYGHAKFNCDVIVSGGLGCSIMPVRLGVPPEIVEVTLGAGAAVA